MIVWINGAFGSGKTTVAAILNGRINNSFIFDPEQAGYCFRKLQPQELHMTDFQDEPLWRRVCYVMLKDLSRKYDGVIIVPMTLYSVTYYREIITALRDDGIDVRHFLLSATKKEICRRLNKRLDRKNSWPARQVDKCLKGFADPIFENIIDTNSISASQTAELILRRLSF